MQEFWANNSCDPFTTQSTTCQLGNYVSYSVDVAGVDDIISTLQFATENNVRLVVRNTGHEYVLAVLEIIRQSRWQASAVAHVRVD